MEDAAFLFVCWTFFGGQTFCLLDVSECHNFPKNILGVVREKLVFTVGVSRQENFVLFTAGRAVGKKTLFC